MPLIFGRSGLLALVGCTDELLLINDERPAPNVDANTPVTGPANCEVLVLPFIKPVTDSLIEQALLDALLDALDKLGWVGMLELAVVL